MIVKTDGSFAVLVAAAAVCGEEGLGFPPAARVMTRAGQLPSCRHTTVMQHYCHVMSHLCHAALSCHVTTLTSLALFNGHVMTTSCTLW